MELIDCIFNNDVLQSEQYFDAPRLWKELPDNIKAADSVQNFKTQLKTLLFQKEFI